MSRALFPSKHSGDAVVPRRTEKFQDNPFSRYSFFFSLCYQRNGKVRGEVFSSLVSVRAYSAKFLIGSETLVRKRAKFFIHKCENCKRLILVVRFLKIGCQTKTFLKYLPRLSPCYEISVSPV